MSDNQRRTVIDIRRPFVLFLVCGVVVIFAVFAFRHHSAPAPSPTKIWSLDLSVDKDFKNRFGVEEVSLDPPAINFLNNSQIICDFYSGAKIGAGEAHSLTGYHVLEIDGHTGALGRRLGFNAFENNYRALPVADGGFVVLANDELRKFSNQFVPGSSYSTPRAQEGQYFDHWLIDVAPGGNTVLLSSHQSGEKLARWTRLHTTDLTATESVNAYPTQIIRASETAGIFDNMGDLQLLSSGKATVLCTRCGAYFLTNDLLFLDKVKSYSIQTIAGEKRGSGTLDVEAGALTRAAQATRFAYVTGHYVGSGFPIQSHFDSISGRIMVIDWTTNKPLAEIDVSEPARSPSAGFTQMALALSPDGKSLAVLLHHTLSLYRLN